MLHLYFCSVLCQYLCLNVFPFRFSLYWICLCPVGSFRLLIYFPSHYCLLKGWARILLGDRSQMNESKSSGHEMILKSKMRLWKVFSDRSPCRPTWFWRLSIIPKWQHISLRSPRDLLSQCSLICSSSCVLVPSSECTWATQHRASHIHTTHILGRLLTVLATKRGIATEYLNALGGRSIASDQNIIWFLHLMIGESEW